MLGLQLGLFITVLVILIKSATSAIQTLTKLAVFFKLSEFTAAFILMAIATSLPELTVGINSALENKPNLALGMVLGANIINLTLVIGLPALLANGLRIESKIRNRDLFYTIILSMMPIILLADATLSRSDGIALLILFLLYLYRLMSQRESFSKKFNHEENIHSLGYYLIKFGLEMVVLVFSAHYLVLAASNMAELLQIPIVVIGAAIVAFGTTLPELTFELYAVRKRESGLALGNILGSVVTNSCLVLGMVALISPITPTNPGYIAFISITWTLVLIVFSLFLRSQYKLTASEGFILVMFYSVLILLQYSYISAFPAI